MFWLKSSASATLQFAYAAIQRCRLKWFRGADHGLKSQSTAEQILLRRGQSDSNYGAQIILEIFICLCLNASK